MLEEGNWDDFGQDVQIGSGDPVCIQISIDHDLCFVNGWKLSAYVQATVNRLPARPIEQVLQELVERFELTPGEYRLYTYLSGNHPESSVELVEGEHYKMWQYD
jgi:hypothetical protein